MRPYRNFSLAAALGAVACLADFALTGSALSFLGALGLGDFAAHTYSIRITEAGDWENW